MFPTELADKAEHLLQECRERNIHLVTAESCTGGLIGGALTEIAGSSDVVEGGYIVYSNHAKMTLLGVLDATLQAHGAVSSKTANEMAQGALLHHKKEYAATDTYLSVAVTGVAGPGGGSEEKPVGTVWFGCGIKHPNEDTATVTTEKHIFPGNRSDIRAHTINNALDMLLKTAQDFPKK